MPKHLDLHHRLAAGQELAPWLVSAVLVALLAHAAAKLTWRVLAPPTTPPAAQVAPAATSADLDAGVRSLIAASPFGAAESSVPGDAPATRLALTLRGVIATGDTRSSRAFIAQANGEERSYAIGAALPGGAKLAEVRADRVLLERNGQFESLSLPREALGGSVPASSAGAVSQSEVQAVADGNPQRLLDVVRPVAATDSNTGRMLGYRVYPGRDADRFARLGLMPGDLITSINGTQLDDPARGLEVLKGLTANQNVMLNVERDGQQRLINVPMSQ